MPDLLEAIRSLEGFAGPSLTRRIASLEAALVNANLNTCSDILARESVSRELLAGAYQMKRAAGQINVVIHALGILLAIPYILEPSERIKYLSLGAGNTGREFDLETDLRVAEFKFIDWQGGSETIRQNSLFKDFFRLAEKKTRKRKFLYVLGTAYPIKFFNSRRSLKSVMSRNSLLWDEFQDRYGTEFLTVKDYFSYNHKKVIIEDISAVLGQVFSAEDISSPEDGA